MNHKTQPFDLPGPETQRICVNKYWPANICETQRINHTATLNFAFNTYRKRQSVMFSLNPALGHQKRICKPKTQIKADGIQKTMRWQALIGTHGIESKADLARYLGVSRARVTRVLKRLNK